MVAKVASSAGWSSGWTAKRAKIEASEGGAEPDTRLLARCGQLLDEAVEGGGIIEQPTREVEAACPELDLVIDADREALARPEVGLRGAPLHAVAEIDGDVDVRRPGVCRRSRPIASR